VFGYILFLIPYNTTEMPHLKASFSVVILIFVVMHESRLPHNDVLIDSTVSYVCL